MIHVALVRITKADPPNHFNVAVDIGHEDAIDPMDAGRTEMIALRKDKAVSELKVYEDLGYTLKSQISGMLESIGLIE
jgi:hypothetical protein